MAKQTHAGPLSQSYRCFVNIADQTNKIPDSQHHPNHGEQSATKMLFTEKKRLSQQQKESGIEWCRVSRVFPRKRVV